MRPFTYNALPSRVVFGHGTISQIKSELQGLDCRKAFVLTTPQQADLGHRVQADLGDWAVGLYTNATMHTPIEITEQAVALAITAQADCIVAAGGGSTTGLGKAMALRTGLPQIVLPTTYAGSEVSPEHDTDDQRRHILTLSCFFLFFFFLRPPPSLVRLRTVQRQPRLRSRYFRKSSSTTWISHSAYPCR
jgi:alcohol dehydrogenase class IV